MPRVGPATVLMSPGPSDPGFILEGGSRGSLSIIWVIPDSHFLGWASSLNIVPKGALTMRKQIEGTCCGPHQTSSVGKQILSPYQ